MIDLLFILTAAMPDGGLGSPADIWAAIVHDFSNIGSPEALAAFGQVVLIDLVLQQTTRLWLARWQAVCPLINGAR